MKKQVLVTVDRGETRVAMMEAAGTPSSPKDTKKGARPKAGNTPAGYRVAEIYFTRLTTRRFDTADDSTEEPPHLTLASTSS